MFTGIVEELGEVVRLDWRGFGEREERAPASPAIASKRGHSEREERAPAGPAIASKRGHSEHEEPAPAASTGNGGSSAVIAVRGPKVTADAAPGDSIAVSGVCLTVVDVRDDVFTADVMRETFDRTALGSSTVGDPVNLERAATMTTRLGGHIVQGHVDGVGTMVSKFPGDRSTDVRIALPPGLDRYVVEKGSICVDGISLTVVAVEPDSFTVSLIPTTLELTTLGRKEPGALVNLEVDVIAKYVEKLVSQQFPSGRTQ